MKRNLYLTSLVTALALAGCQKDIQQSKEQSTSLELRSSAKPSAQGNSTVNLSVTVDDASVNNILSDGNGAYVHGTDRVDAQILSSDGNFYMNTNNNTVKAAIRTMQFLPGNSGFDLSGKRNYSLRTNASVWLQNMAVNTSQNVGFRVWGVLQGGIVDWRLLFRNGLEEIASSLTDYAKVTRLSNDVWTIEPASYTGVTPANARLIDGNNNPIGLGYYQTPFKLTLTRTNR